MNNLADSKSKIVHDKKISGQLSSDFNQISKYNKERMFLDTIYVNKNENKEEKPQDENQLSVEISPERPCINTDRFPFCFEKRINNKEVFSTKICNNNQEIYNWPKGSSTSKPNEFSLKLRLLSKENGIKRQAIFIEKIGNKIKRINYNLISKDMLGRSKYTKSDSYNKKVINDIIFNENTHTVSVIKEFLLWDDFSEFFKRFYRKEESSIRLIKIYDFYDQSSKVFHNYFIIPESKFMFKNIEKKQKFLDEQHKEKHKEEKMMPNKIFSIHFIKEMEKSIDKNTEKTVQDLTLNELLTKFIQKDSILDLEPKDNSKKLSNNIIKELEPFKGIGQNKNNIKWTRDISKSISQLNKITIPKLDLVQIQNYSRNKDNYLLK